MDFMSKYTGLYLGREKWVQLMVEICEVCGREFTTKDKPKRDGLRDTWARVQAKGDG